MKLLIVDDEIKIREVIKEYALKNHFQVAEASSGIEAMKQMKKTTFDLIILDIMMPKMDGFTFLENCQIRPPVIVLSAKREEMDKLTGFELGIDDYLTKPFSPKELMARCKAILARTKPIQNRYQYQEFSIDFLSHEVKIKKKILQLTPKEFELLSFFIQNKNIAISREQLLNQIWGFSFYGDNRTVDAHIKMLRKHLGPYRNLIQTIRGVGYKYVEDEKE